MILFHNITVLSIMEKKKRKKMRMKLVGFRETESKVGKEMEGKGSPVPVAGVESI